MSQETCPNRDQFQALLDGKLANEIVESLASHVEACPDCANTVASINSDTLSDALRTSTKSAADPQESGLRLLMDKLTSKTPTMPDQTIDSTPGQKVEASSPGNTIEILAMLGKPLAPDELGRLGVYRVLRQLGQGGMGMVFEAEDAKLERRVALKVMKPDIARNAQHRERFLREAKTAAKVESDYICPIYQVGEENGAPFIAMPFLKGEALDARIKRGEPFTVEEVVRIGTEVAEGLSAAHDAGLIHRDIKPANIWMETQRSGPPRARILDFGLARVQADDVHITQSGAILGTPAYMSPEQARGEKNVDGRADLFSLGCVLYSLTTGDMPFKAETTMGVLMALATKTPLSPRERSQDVPTDLSNLVMALLEKDADKRPADAKEVIALLADVSIPAAGRKLNAPVVKKADQTAVLSQPGKKSGDTMTSEAAAPERKRTELGDSSKRRSPNSFITLVAFALLGGLFLLLGGGVYYIVTDKGTIQIETADKSIKVILEDGGGKITVLDPKSKQSWIINTGKYTMRLADNPDGLEIDLPRDRAFEMKRGGELVVTIKKIDGPVAIGKKDDPKIVKVKEVGKPNATPTVAYALHFDARDRVIFPPLKLDGPSFTVEAWVTPPQPHPAKTALVLAVPGISLMTYEGKELWLNIRSSKPIIGPGVIKTPMVPGRRSHVACVHVDKELRLYVDGSLAGRMEVPPGPLNPAPAPPSLFGTQNLCPGYRIDTIRISKVARYDKDFTPAKRFEPDADTLALNHFDEGQGDVLRDSSGNNHHGTIIGAKWVKIDGTPPPPMALSQDYALLFEKSDKFVNDVRVQTLKIGKETHLTVEAFVTPTHEMKAVNVAGTELFLGAANNAWSFGGLGTNVNGAAQMVFAKKGPIEKGRRVHLAGVRSGDRMLLFVDGKKVAEALGPKLEFKNAGPFMIGAFFTGAIDEVRVSKVARYNKDFAPAKRHEPDADTLALYHCDEGSGDKLTDSSGNGHHGTIIGAKWVKADGTAIGPRVEYALKFDGVSSVVTAPSPAWNGTDPLTLEAYVTAGSDAEGTIVHLRSPGFAKLYIQRGLWNGTAVPIENGKGQISEKSVELNKKTHLAGVWNGKSFELFVNGKKQFGGGYVVKIPVLQAAQKFHIGADYLSAKKNYFDGRIHEIRVSKSVRYTKDFTQPARHEPDKDTLALYHFDEGQGDKLTDSSGNGHHGKIVGAKWVKVDGGHLPAFASLNYGLQIDAMTVTPIPSLKLGGHPNVTLEGTFQFHPAKTTALRMLMGTKEFKLEYSSMNNKVHISAKGFFLPEPPATVHLAITRSPNQLALFIDGKKVQETKYSQGPLADDDPFQIGLMGIVATARGLRVSKVVRYQNDFTPAIRFQPDADTLALWHCDDGQGDKLTDVSGNGHHGKIVGAKWVKADGTALDANRRAAEWVLSRRKGELGVRINGQYVFVPENGKLPNEPFHLDGFQVIDPSVGDDDLSRFAGLPELKGINLHTCSITDAGLTKLGPLPKLALLNLERTKVTGEGLAVLRNFPALRELVLSDTALVDAGLTHLAALASLEKLFLKGTNRSEASVKKLAAVLPKCRIVWDGGVIEPTTGADADRRAAEWVLSCQGTVKVDDQEQIISHAANLPNGPYRLTRLWLWSKTPFTDAALVNLKDCRNLKELSIFNTRVSDTGLGHLKECTSLTRLSLGKSPLVTDAGLAFFKDCKNLEDIDLRDTPVTDKSVDTLVGFARLTNIILRGTKLSETGVKKLAAALPQCKIVWDGGTIEPTANLDPDRRAAEYALSIGGAVQVNGEALNDITAAADLPRAPFRLTYLLLGNNKQASDTDLFVFKDCKNLTGIFLASSSVGDTGLAHFKDCEKLLEIDVRSTPVSDASLAIFKDRKNLTRLYLATTFVSDTGLAHFKGLQEAENPRCGVDSGDRRGFCSLQELQGNHNSPADKQPNKRCGPGALQGLQERCAADAGKNSDRR